MKSLFINLLSLAALVGPCVATSTVPFKPQSVTVDYGFARRATFTFEPPRFEQELRLSPEDRRKALFSFSQPEEIKAEQKARSGWSPGTKVVKIEFTFSDGRKAEVPDSEIKDIELIGIIDSEIETLIKDGSWALSIRIKNVRNIPARIADDRVVFIFEDYNYSKRRLEIDDKWNANK